MVKFKQHLLIVSLSGSFLGCSPLQQAPLVYSSKVVVGVDLSGTTTEQPGVSINVGYKQVDAAYVPVAVAKPCDVGGANVSAKETNGSDTELKKGSADGDLEPKNVDCTSDIYKLMEVAGNNNVEDTRGDGASVEKARQRIAEFKALDAAKNTALKEYDSARSAKESNEKILNEMKNSYQSIVDKVDNEGVEKLDSDQNSIYQDYSAKLLAFNKSVTDLEAAEKKLETEQSALLNANTAELIQALNTAGLDNEKKDAFSVFGSFDANTKAVVEVDGTSKATAETGLVLGKVFSTGVASQNLTEGMRKYYESDGLALIEAEKSPATCVIRSLSYLESFKSLLDLKKESDNERFIKMHEDILELCQQKKILVSK